MQERRHEHRPGLAACPALVQNHSCYVRAGYAAHSLDTPNPQLMGMVWTNTSGQPGIPTKMDCTQTSDPCTGGQTLAQRTYADGQYPVVLPSGRVVMGFRDRGEPTTIPPGQGPLVTWSDTGGDVADPVSGLRWQPAQRLNSYGPPSQNLPIFAPVGSGANWAGAGLWWPTLDCDPTHATWVYAAIIGRTSESATSNDIWIALSIDSGASFPALRTVHITDDMLRPSGLPEGQTSEFHVSIAIDHLGGINLLYYRAVLMIDQPNFEARYAHWPSFDDIQQGHPATVLRLSDSFYGWPYGGHHDYIMMRRAGCMLYAGFTTSETGNWDGYAAVIDPVPGSSCALADANGDGHVDATDLAAFLAAFAAAAPAADIDTNWAVEAPDAVAFLAAYANATSGH